MGAFANPSSDDPPHANWAERAKRAHYNAIENLVVFAPLVLIANATNISTQTTIVACQLYFWARLGHYIVYTLGITVVRSLLFFAGLGAQIMMAFAILQII